MFKLFKDKLKPSKEYNTLLPCEMRNSTPGKLTYKEFFQALEEANLNQLRRHALAKGKFTPQKNSDSVLHVAARKANVKLMRFLLQQDINVDKKNNQGKTPLHIAAGESSLVCCQLLVARGANLNLKNKAGTSVLHYAASSSNVEILNYFLNMKMPANVRNECKDTPLMFAAFYGQLDNVKRLLAQPETSIDAQNKDGWTAMHFAARFGFAEILHFLLDKGGSLLMDKKSRDPAQIAKIFKHAKCQSLIEDHQKEPTVLVL